MPSRSHDMVPGWARLARNPASLLGVFLALLGLSALSFALALNGFNVRPSPYIGVLAYLLLPAVVVMGLLLVGAGMAAEARRQAAAARRGETVPTVFEVDLADPRHARRILFFGIGIAVILGVSGAAGMQAVKFTDSVTFCGQTCHKVMAPQFEPYKQSPHARVACTTCHIGSEASWWVRSKLSGVGQVFATLFNTYPRPVPAPIEHLRPARDTCETCHWRERAYGIRLRVYRQYLPDERTTLLVRPLAFRVGTGGEEPGGVHWHIAARLWYRAADDERQSIGWVRVEDPQGAREWRNPAIPPERLREPRLMDCIDCHNRVSHEVSDPEQLIDEALTSGRLDRTLPYLKREALRLLSAKDPSPDAAVLAATWSDGWWEQLWDFYRQNYPDVALAQVDSIQQAINELQRISKQVIYPDMNTTWRTYANNSGHVSSAGCFRCHGVLVSTDAGQRQPSGDCDSCHYELPPEQIKESPAG